MRSAVELWRNVLAPKTQIDGAAWNCLGDATTSCPQESSRIRAEDRPDAQGLYLEGRWEQLAALPAPATVESSEWLWRGVALAKTEDCPKAIVPLERGLTADGMVAAFWLQVCYSSEAERAAAQLIKEKDERAFHQLRGDLLLRLRGNPSAALREYDEAVKLQPENPALLERSAEAYAALGDTAHAKKSAMAALAIDPYQREALRTIAQTDIKDRNYADALESLKRSAAIDPRDAWAQVELGVAYGELGHPEEAVHYLQRELAAGYPDKKGALHAQLARALRKLGREDDADKAAAEAASLANAALEGSEQERIDAPQ
jgi:predicted Zn-dependent protease